MRFPIHVLDVFAERRLAGNPLAVVRHDGRLDGAAMQSIALETNLSETTFLTGEPGDDGSFPVRIFTPTRELPFAGHPTLGTAWFLRHRVLATPRRRIVLDLPVGHVPVDFEGDGEDAAGFFRGPAAELAEVLEPEEMAAVLGLRPEDVDPTTAPRRVLAGLEFLIVPLRGADRLAAASIDAGAASRLTARGLNPFLYVFCRETVDPENQIAARFFFDANGFREDPATGSAANALGHFLLDAGGGTESLDLRLEQGVLMGRPSLIRIRASLTAAGPEVAVGGRVFETLRGELLLE